VSIPKLTEATLRRYANAQSFQRGDAYYRAGAVINPTQRGNTLQAEVEGSRAEPYQVRLTFDEGGVTSADCTCAYNFEGWCKHIVATLLVCLRQPETVAERPPLEALLDRLEPAQLRQLVQALAAEQPALLEAIDRQVGLLATPAPAAPPAKPPRRTTVDPTPFRRQVRQILRNAVNDWESGSDEDSINDDLQDLIDQAQEFTERGDSPNALAILEAITGACVEHWEDVADYGADSNEVVAALDEAWTEAILSGDLTPAETIDLQGNLAAWEKELSGSFAMSLAALRQGWSYPPLQQALQGQRPEAVAWDGERPDYADALALIRLRILDRQERRQEYLHLAEAEGQTEQYLTMLARLGQVEAAMTAAQTRLKSLPEAFALARILREQGALEQALAIAQTGLKLLDQDHRQYELAVWTSELAEGLGNRPAALGARIAAFLATPFFTDYQKTEELAGEEWAAVRTELLEFLRNSQSWGIEEAKVDIFLHEGLIASAITTVQDLRYYHADLVQRVMDAAMSERPDWVIDNARRRAEEIMDAGKANAYHHAIDWLKKARAAYRAMERQAEWSAYREQLLVTHGRKYKLVGMLKQRELA